MNKKCPYTNGFLLVALACCGFSLTGQADTDGDLGNGNTAEDSGALASLTSGTYKLNRWIKPAKPSCDFSP